MGILLALLLAAGPAAAPKKIAVLDVRAGPKVDPSLGPYLTQVMAAEVAARTGTSPLVSADIKALLGFEKTRRSLGCDDEGGACIAELAGALGVDEVVNVQLLTSDGPDGKPDRYLLTTTRLDAHKAVPVARDAQSIPFGDNAALEAAVRRAAVHLYGGPAAAQPKDAGATRPPAPAEATSASAPPAHRTVTWVAAAGTAALVAGAGVTGAAALSSANAGNASARTTAHAADGLWAAAALCAGLTVWLWLGDAARH